MRLTIYINMTNALICILFLLLQAGGVNGCLTWNIDGNSIRFICRIEDSETVSLVDNHGQDVARCELNGSHGNCSSLDFVKSIIQETVVTFYIDMSLKTDVNGNWSCLQQDNTFMAELLTSQGLADSTIVNLFGKIVRDDDVIRLLLVCSSCRIPKGKNAEFLTNNNSVDSLSFNDETGKCTHLHGECISGECNCSPSGNTFSRSFLIERPFNTSTYFSCDMRFEDKANSEVFSKVTTVSFNGKEFNNRGTKTVITKLWNDHNRPKDNTNDTVAVSIAVICAAIVVAFIFFQTVHRILKNTKEVEQKRHANDGLKCKSCGMEPYTIAETSNKSVQVNSEEDTFLSDAKCIKEPDVTIDQTELTTDSDGEEETSSGCYYKKIVNLDQARTWVTRKQN